MPESDIDCVANEGVRISKVFELLKAVRLPNAEHQVLLAKLLGDIGFFSEAPIRGTVSEGRPSPLIATSTDGVPESRSPINVVVNGTANFYLGADAPTAPPPPPLPTAVPAISSLPAIAATVVEKRVRFDPNYDDRKGYDPKFLDGFTVVHPRGPLDEVLKRGNGQLILKYYHYSLVMHRERQLAMWTAANADYHKILRRKTREEWGEDHWKADPRISGDAQIEDFEFYDPAAKFDKGHLVRRDDVAWGKTSKEEEFGNSDSFHWTNCSPQHEGFNRDMFQYNGLWGELENHITKQAQFVGKKCIIFSGPVLDEDDPVHDFGDDIVMQVPKDFWKVIVVVENTNGANLLRAYGFVLDQTDAIEEYGWERRFNVGKFEEQQLSLRDITALSRVTFDDAIYAADPLADVVEESLRQRTLKSLDDLVLA
jgi:endonuclease G